MIFISTVASPHSSGCVDVFLNEVVRVVFLRSFPFLMRICIVFTELIGGCVDGTPKHWSSVASCANAFSV